MASSDFWTSDRVEQLKALHAKELAYSDMADALGISRSMVSGKLQRLGLQRPDYVPIVRYWTEQRVAELKELFDEGLTDRQIAERMGCTSNAIEKKRPDLGLKRKPQRARYKVVNAEKPRAITPTFKIVAANGHTSQKRVIESVVADMRPIRCVEVVPLNIPLLDLEPHHCRYPVTEEGPHLFCGRDKFSGAYCTDHYFLTIGPGTTSERNALNLSRKQVSA